jgi:sugar lactone lactonase YvrE
VWVRAIDGRYNLPTGGEPAVVNTIEGQVLMDGIGFGEGLRWHDGALWFSDIPRHRVMRCWPDGRSEVVVELPTAYPPGSGPGWGPSGLGFLPDGSLLISVMSELDPWRARILRFQGSDLTEYCDLSQLVTGRLNDMVVDGDGHVYVGAYDEGKIVHVSPDGTVSIVVSGLVRPNGTVVAADRSQIIFANSSTFLSSAAIDHASGSLGPRKIWAELTVEAAVRRAMANANPQEPVLWGDLISVGHADGIALDAGGGIWAGGASTEKFMRVTYGGIVTDLIRTPGRYAICCALGGDDRKTLFMATTKLTGAATAKGGVGSPTLIDKIQSDQVESFIEVAMVDEPGVGWP